MKEFESLDKKRKALKCTDGSEGYGYTDIDLKKALHYLKDKLRSVTAYQTLFLRDANDIIDEIFGELAK
jgi:hypothetical protein